MLIRVDHVSYTYGENTVYAVKALEDVSLSIGKGEMIGLIGHTGSGKSTLIQTLNGLIRPTGGTVFFEDEDIFGDGYDRRLLRTKVGLVFQYPENQLFDTTVLKDVCFGPKNQGLSDEEAEKRAKEALALTGVSEELFDNSPFDLSGGQKRRVAIAGILAMGPEVMILDEPTAGLDPEGRYNIWSMLELLHKERGMTVIVVSHSMEDMAEHAERLLVMDEGRLVFDAPPKDVFAHSTELAAMGLAAPELTQLMKKLAAKGMNVDETAATVTEAKESILSCLGIGK